jgi:hypothetical protein
MALEINEDGSIDIYQGDSGSIFVHNLNKDKNYLVYFNIYNNKREIVVKLEPVEAKKVEFVELKLLPSDTDKLVVPLNKNSETYYYGILIQEIGTNNVDTLFVANGTYGDLTELVVYPKKVERT